MKNKFNFLVKLICLVSILISVSIFIVFVMNFESTKVKLASAGKVNINSDSQGGSIKPTIYEVVLEDEASEDMVVHSNQEDVEEIIENKNTENFSEIELNSENCEYSVDETKETIHIDEYNVNVDCIVIPSEIDGKKVEDVNTEDFSNCYNLETIKISKEISNQIKEIPDFEINKELEEENYVVYTTTREYGEAYKGYLELSEEEKSKVNIIPPKYEMPLEIYSQNNIKEFQPVGGITDNSAYDLRDDIYIKVEDQNPYGICYAYSSFTAAETFWSLNNNETIDFSEVHAAILTTGNGGSTFVKDTAYYANKIGPVYEEEYPIYGVRSATLTNASNIEACIESTTPSSYSSVQSTAKTEIPVKYITGTKQFPTVTQAIKQDSAYDAALADVRDDIKNHIKTYGALATVVNSNAIQEYNGKMVANDQSSSAVNHGVTVIGWDDNFDVSNFPSSCRPSENGAYLVLNSWGSDWGENGCYWVSYEDKWIEYYLIGVTAMTEASENLQASSMVVTDQETGNVLDNGNIEDGTKIKMEVDVTVTTPISGETIEVSLRNNIADYTSYMTVTGTNLVNNKANIEMLVDTEELKGNQYVLEINYGTETISKMIETPKDFLYSVNADGTITMIAYRGSDKEVVVPAIYDGYTVSTIGKDTFMSCEVEKITIEKGITTISDYAFRGCETLTEITLPRTLKTIGTAPFIGCSNLTQLIIPRSVTTIGPGLVQYCTNLKELVIFKEATSIGSYMFYPSQSATIYCESGSTAASYASTNSYIYSIITSSYNITYNKNAGTDTVSNMPSTQNKVKYDTISMSSNIPVRSGYEFLGWATSSSAVQAQYQPGDDYRTDSNLNLYAVWKATEKEIRYTVQYYKDGVATELFEVCEITDISQTTINVDKSQINTTDKYLGYELEKTEPAVIPDAVTDGTVIKVYYKTIKYNITYDLDGGDVKDGENPDTYTVNELISLLRPEKEGYTFIGWTGSNGNTPQTRVVIEPGTTGNKSYKANYTINSYTLEINYITEKGDEVAQGYTETLNYLETFEVISPEVYGYIPDTPVVKGTMGTEDIYIDVIYSRDLVTYTVNHYKQNIDGNGYVLEEVELREGYVGDEAVAVPKEYPGFTCDRWIRGNIIEGDGYTSTSAYYNRNIYTLNYFVDGEKYGESEQYRYETAVTLREKPTKLGYNFDGWYYLSDKSNDSIEITQDVDLYGTFIKDESQTKDLSYIVEYYIDGIKQDADTETKNITVHVSEPDTISVNKDEINTTNKYSGYELEKTEPATIPDTVNNGDVIKVYYTVETYDITYDLDGGKLPNGKENPTSYTVNDTFVLITPEKEGYTFTGWTGSNGNTPEKTVTVAKGTTGNKNYKANFDINSYKVTYRVDGEEYGEVEFYEYGEVITPREEPTKTGYKFSGWGQIPETMPARDIELSGMFYLDGTQVKELNYTVEYYKDNVKQDIDTDIEKTIVQVLETDEITVDKSKINTESKYLGYNFEKTEPAVLPEKVTSGTVIKVYYTVQNYAISYDLDGGSLPDGKINPETYTVNDSFVLEAPEREGHTFIGWTGSNGEEPETSVTIAKGTIGNKNYKANYSVNKYMLVINYDIPNNEGYGPISYYEMVTYGDRYYKEVMKCPGYTPSMNVVEGVMGAEDITFIIKYTPNTDTRYLVECYLQNIYDDNYVENSSKVFYGTTDTLTEVEAPEKTGFTAKEVTQENINGDGSTVVKIYYDRNQYECSYFLRDDENSEYYLYKTITYRYYQPVSQINVPTKYGRTFYGWERPPLVMPANDINIYGTFKIDESQTKELKYTVEYYKNGIKQDADTQVEKLTVQVLQPDTIPVDKTKINTVDKYIGYEFYGTNFSEIPETIGRGGVIKVYYIPIEYTITYDLGGGNLTENNPEIYTIEDEVKLNNPEKLGYTFTGWTGSNGETPEKSVTINKGTIGNKEYKANYNINTYTLKYIVDGEQYGEIENYEYNQVITPREVPTKRGYIFSGWSEIPEKMPANDVEVTGTFAIDESQAKTLKYTVEYYKDGVKQDADTEIEEIKVLEYEPDEITVNKEKINTNDKYLGYAFEKTEPAEMPEKVMSGDVIKVYYSVIHYKITYSLSGGHLPEGKSNPTTYTVNDTFTLVSPIKKGFTFKGWIGGPAVIEKGTTGNKSYTADYKINEYKLTIKCISESNGKCLETINLDCSFGEKYKITLPEIAGYTCDKNEITGVMGSEDTIIEVYYKANIDTKYIVEHYKQNILDNNYTLVDTEDAFGTTDTLTAAESKEYLGFTVKEYDQENINGNGSTVVRIYYDRNVYLLTYIVDGKPDGEPEEYRFEETIVPKEYPNKLGYKFSGWSEIPEKMPANNIETTGTFIFDESQTKTLSYIVEYYKDGIKQDADTEIENVIVHILASDEITVNKEKINIVDKYEACTLDSTLTQIPEKVVNGDIIKVYYNRKDAKINVEYRDFVTGEEISEKVIKIAKVFDTYDISEDIKEIEGHTFIEGPESLTGEYTEEEQTKVYKYAKNSKVTVNYIEKTTGEQIAETVVIDGYETKEYDTEEKVIENYVLVETTNNTSGKMAREEIVVTYYYIYVSKGVVERHIDVITNEVLDTKLYEGNEGDSYKTEPKEFEGYDLVEERMPTNAEGIMTKDAIIVEYFYIRNASVKVQYIDKISNAILDEEIIYGNQNDTYETEAKEFDGYRLVETPTNTEGTMIVTKDENQNVITETLVVYYYKKLSEGVIEKHIDIKTNEVLEEKAHSGLEGDSYKVEPKEFEGYDLVEERLPINAEGTMTEEKIEVNYYYIRKTTVRVEYIDVITNEKILEDVVINNHEGDQYKAERKEFEGYDLVEERLPTNEEGITIVTKDENDNVVTEIVVKYYYIRKATVKVEYIDKETGEKISEDTLIEGREGDAYKAEPKEIEGYNLLEEKENAEGTMSKEEIVAKFYYEKKLDSEEYLIKENEIKKIVIGTTISDLKDNISTEENYVILDEDGNEVSEAEVIKTGMKLKLDDGKEYDLVVRGDLNCDGKVTLTDVSKLILHYNGNKGFILSGSPCEAADMNYDDKITLTDVSQMVVFYNSI